MREPLLKRIRKYICKKLGHASNPRGIWKAYDGKTYILCNRCNTIVEYIKKK